VTATLATHEPAAAPAVGTGNLSLRLPSGTEAQVWVDGAQLAEWKRPIALRADVPHEIRVTRAGAKEVKTSVTLKAGEEATRDINFESALGKINVVTEPAGAEVSVNGKKAGLTPATVTDVDAARPARLTVRHRGYAPITKYVNFDKGLEQTFEIKMSTSADDGFAEEAVAEKVEKPEKADKDHPRSSKEKKEKATSEVATAPRPLLSMDDDESSGAPHPLKEKSSEAKASAPAGNDAGFLVANTQPWAKVLIDGKDTGKTTPIAPRSKIPLKPGKHVVTFVANGKKFNFDVVIKANEDTRLIKQLTDGAN
jgi:hypothetical protein